MNNSATKNQAVQLIARAKRDGWRAKVESTRLHPVGKVWHTTVSLRAEVLWPDKDVDVGGLVLVTFRHSLSTRRIVVTVRSLAWGAKVAVPGLWSASYLVGQVAEGKVRQAGYAAKRALEAASNWQI